MGVSRDAQQRETAHRLLHSAAAKRSRKPLQPKVTSIQEVLSDAKDVDFDNEASWKLFQAKHHNRLSKGPPKKEGRNAGAPAADEVLHVVAVNPDHFKSQQKEFTRWAIHHHRNLLQCTSTAGDTPLHKAIDCSNHGFVELVLNELNVESSDGLLEELLTQTCQVGHNCLHRAVSRSSPLTEAIIDILWEDPSHSSHDKACGGGWRIDADESDSDTEPEITMARRLADERNDIFAAPSWDKLRGHAGWTALHFAVLVEEGLEDDDEEHGYNRDIDTMEDEVARNKGLSIQQQPEYVAASFRGDLDGQLDIVDPFLDPFYTPAPRPIHIDAPDPLANPDVSLAFRGPLDAAGVGDHIFTTSPTHSGSITGEQSPKAFAVQVTRRRTVEPEPSTTSEAGYKSELDTSEDNTSDVSIEEGSGPGRIRKREYNQLEVVKKLIEARPSVLLSKDDEEKDTPFQLRLRGLQDFRRNCQQRHDESIIDGGSYKSPKDMHVDDQDETEQNGDHLEEVKIINDDPVLRYIREYVIDRFDRRKAMEALYKVGCERVIEFDLSGLPYTSINADFLHGLGKVLRFEGLLKYVALPRLTVNGDPSNIDSLDVPRRGQHELAGSQSKAKGGKGLQNMCAIFKWLKRLDVQTVLKVTVIDDTEPSHSDEAIETCMTGLNVRVWNWYKVDLCADVIFNSAPNVTEVTLYSSGSNAVLVGWSSSAGLVKLKKLKKVHVYVREGLETATRLERYRNTFESELTKQIPNIKISWGVDMPNYDSLFTGSNAEKPLIESKWLKTMKTFATFLQSAQPSRPIPPVKIAIIDDGINTTLPIFSNRIQVGESFYRPGAGRRHGAYYVPTGPHGTLMAQLICEICPVVKLYIAQLEYVPAADDQRTHGRPVGRGGGAGRSFTTESAIEAINWAVSQGVDIISMSWSIASTSGVDLPYSSPSNIHSMNSNVIHPLDKALSDAVLNQIVMFCSSTDQGPTAVDNTYPGRNPSVIKVGASTGQGAKLSWVSGSKSDFLLPGEATVHTGYGYGPSHDSGIGGDGSVEALGYGGHSSGAHVPTASGSSISTALAAGLAGVLIYCERLLNSESLASSVSMKDSKSQTDGLKAAGKMKEAFEHMSKGTELSKFPQVWDYVPTHLDDADFRRGNPSALEVQGMDGTIANSTSSSRILRWNKKAYPVETAATKMKLEEFLKRIWK